MRAAAAAAAAADVLQSLFVPSPLGLEMLVEVRWRRVSDLCAVNAPVSLANTANGDVDYQVAPPSHAP